MGGDFAGYGGDDRHPHERGAVAWAGQSVVELADLAGHFGKYSAGKFLFSERSQNESDGIDSEWSGNSQGVSRFGLILKAF
jgi:hypothetical protein